MERGDWLVEWTESILKFINSELANTNERSNFLFLDNLSLNLAKVVVN